MSTVHTITEDQVIVTLTGDAISVTYQAAGSASVTEAAVAAVNAAATAKDTPIDADSAVIVDSAASNGMKRVTWARVKAVLKTYFDSVYSVLALGETSATAYPGDRGKAAYDHSQGTGSPHTAAGVGAEASGAVSSHAGKTDGTAHGDSGVADPAVSTLTVVGGAVSVAATVAARRFFADNGSATTLTVSAVTGLVNGGEPVTLAVKTTGAGLTVTWPGTPVVWGDAPTAAGEYVFLLWANSSGVLNVLNPGDSG